MFQYLISRITPDNSESITTSERSRVKRSGTKRKKPGIKLTVLSVSSSEGQSMTVECQLDTSKQKTVTFKFDRDDMVPTDIANNLVRIYLSAHPFIFLPSFSLACACHSSYLITFLLILSPGCGKSLAAVPVRDVCRINRRHRQAITLGSYTYPTPGSTWSARSICRWKPGYKSTS